jgi:hypothetical protein
VETQLAELTGTSPKQLKRLLDDISRCLMLSLSKSDLKAIPSSVPLLGRANSAIDTAAMLVPAFTAGLAQAIWSGVSLLVRAISQPGSVAALHQLRINLDLARLRMQLQMLCEHVHVAAAIAGLWGKIVAQCVSTCLAQMQHRSTRLVALSLVALHTVLRWSLPSLMTSRECSRACLLAANQAWVSAWTQLTTVSVAVAARQVDAPTVRDPLLFLVDALLDCSREVLSFTDDMFISPAAAALSNSPGPLKDVSEVLQMLNGPHILRMLVRLAPADQV